MSAGSGRERPDRAEGNQMSRGVQTLLYRKHTCIQTNKPIDEHLKRCGAVLSCLKFVYAHNIDFTGRTIEASRARARGRLKLDRVI